MKPLELTVYPHVVDGGMDCIEDSEGTFRIHRELDDLAQDKRFTDAELAAVKEMGEQLEASELNENEFMRGRGSGFRIAGVRIRQTIRAAVAAAKGDEQ